MDVLPTRSSGVAGPQGSTSRIEQGNGIIQTGGGLTMRDYVNQTHYHNVGGVRDGVLSPEEEAKKAKEAFIYSFEFRGMNERYESVEGNTPNTCKWLLETSEFREWQRSFHVDAQDPSQYRGVRQRRLFWIKGQPGAGKSTYMNFIARQAKGSIAFEGNLILVHFFSARAPNELTKSTEGMYRTILTQILRDLEAKKVQNLALRFMDAHQLARPTEFTWKLETLSSLFGYVLREHNTSPVTCFIDALDECAEDQIRAMVRSFRDLTDEDPTNLQFRACFASRYYPNITIPTNVAVEIRLEQQSSHFRDIERYIDRHLHVSSSRIAGTIREEVRKKAGGSFIWCRLVVDILNKACDIGALNQEEILKNRLSSLPENLRAIFNEVLEARGEAHWDSNAEKAMTLCMQWVLFSKDRDIGPLWWAIQRTARPREETKVLEAEYQSYSRESMKLYILNLCKGLLEVVESRWRRDLRLGELQVIHESVRDFLLKGGLARLMQIQSSDCDEGESEATARSHEKLKEIAFDEGFRRHNTPLGTWLNREEKHRHVAELHRRNPLLSLSLDCFHHANEVLRNDGTKYGLDQALFLGLLEQEESLKQYCDLRHTSPWQSDLHLPSLADVLIHENAGELLRAYCSQPPGTRNDKQLNLHHQLKRHSVSSTILQAVLDIYMGWHKPGSPRRAFLQWLADDIDFEGRTQYYGFETTDDVVLPIWERFSHHKLSALIVAAMLPSTPGVEEELTAWKNTSNSHLSTPRGFASFLFLAFTHFTLREATHIMNLGVVLCWAAKHGEEALCRLLLDKFNAPCNAQELSSGKTALHFATGQHLSSIFGMLLSRNGIDLNLRDSCGNTQLHLAIGRNRTNLGAVQMLLADGRADVNVVDIDGNTPLHTALLFKQLTGFKALLCSGQIDVNIRNKSGYTPLHLSAYEGWKETTTALLAASQANVNSRDLEGNTPLHLAAFSGRCRDIVRTFLATGQVDVNLRNNYHETPKDVAWRRKHWTIAKDLDPFQHSSHLTAPGPASASPSRHSESPRTNSQDQDRFPPRIAHPSPAPELPPGPQSFTSPAAPADEAVHPIASYRFAAAPFRLEGPGLAAADADMAPPSLRVGHWHRIGPPSEFKPGRGLLLLFSPPPLAGRPA